MDQGRVAQRRLSGEKAFASLQFVVAAAMSMVLVVVLVQLIAYQYTRAAVLAGLERGVRVASVAGGGEAACLATIEDSFDGSLSSHGRERVQFSCREDQETISATATGVVPVWVGGGELEFRLESVARRETPG